MNEIKQQKIKLKEDERNRTNNKIKNDKVNDILSARPKVGKIINFNESNKLLNEIENSQITYEEALKIIRNIRRDINKLVSAQGINPNQINVLDILFLVNEIFTRESERIEINEKGDLEISNKEKQESDKQPDTTGMPELESEESAAERKL